MKPPPTKLPAILAPAPPPAPAAPPPPVAARAGSSRDRRTPLEHAEVFMRAGQEALDRDDLVAAAHHYRLALQCHDDPRLRAVLADVEARARLRRDKGKRA